MKFDDLDAQMRVYEESVDFLSKMKEGENWQDDKGLTKIILGK